MNYLDFEKPIAELIEQKEKMANAAQKSGVDVTKTLEELDGKIADKRKEIFGKLTPWQRVQVSRHPDRPYTLAYIEALTAGSFIELHGDRTVKDDKAMVGGLGLIDGHTVMLIGQQKGNNTKMRQYRNFGMPNPEGYRKALRLMKMAEKFNKPIITFIDTPGAYPGLEAEERGQGEAIARNLLEMSKLRVPVICIVIGEGASGGALGIGIGDRVLMLENTWYSVISPESCSSILWRSWNEKERAAEALKLTPEDMKQHGLVDGIIPEPLGGAHTSPEEIFATVKAEILKHLGELSPVNADERITRRIDKFCKMGVVVEG
ncbi:MAG: acetyl-CoA carboxylase carboxyl transferase subunit alpha [Bacteroidetes bacterium]|nr:MAG: acetyl-CoA carboxylase carboxyl transferase subunit alpha [Bacteroidota bacterium]